MSLALAHSRCPAGTAALAIRVETHLSNGLPSFTIVGLPETAVRESRERVRSALLNSGFDFPQRRITVNLAPGDIRKEGTRFDLAIAVGILAASAQVPPLALSGCEFMAELALNGELRAVGASLNAALAASADSRVLILEASDAATAALIETAVILPAGSLREVCLYLQGALILPRLRPAAGDSLPPNYPDLAQVAGQQRARRALESAAAGAHNLLLLGPPGTGKTMLAMRLPGILPGLSEDEAIATAAVHSVAGLPVHAGAWRQRPFRAPHHSSSAAALVGGGRLPRPGEISLAHNGVLFLDELPEFDRRALEALREPLESGSISVARAQRSVRFPAAFMLVAAMNPCPCGYAGDPQVECACTPERVQTYRGRISGPLAERIDIHVEVPRQPLALLHTPAQPPETSADVRARVVAARERQLTRQCVLNGQLAVDELLKYSTLSRDAGQLIAQALDKLALSARAYHKILRLARTLADMEASDLVGSDHVAEAISLRVLDRKMRGH